MKILKTMLVAILGMAAGPALQAQELKDKEVPAAVKDAFVKKYPGSKASKWEKEDSNYEVEFNLNKVESTAVFDASGVFKELEQEIKNASLPKIAIDYCSKNFPAYKLKEATKITAADGKVLFEAQMGKGKEHFDVFFDEKGNFVKKSEIQADKESDKD